MTAFDKSEKPQAHRQGHRIGPGGKVYSFP